MNWQGSKPCPKRIGSGLPDPVRFAFWRTSKVGIVHERPAMTFAQSGFTSLRRRPYAARFPLGPNRTKPFAWDDIWGWAVPKSIPEERKKTADLPVKSSGNALFLLSNP
jgi:hypothetical protein